MLAAKNGEALNERTFGRQKSRINWPYPHGERREVMIATLRWAIECTAAFPHGLCVEIKAGEGMAWMGWEMGGGREKFYSWRRASAFKSGAFLPKRIFPSLSLTFFFCSPHKIPMRK